ncbi:hypothetical protein ZIOFF_037022 [Zingiber officinale]|uniref:Pectinesterase catalytic domain-containing protein n=1 Tax=Zingiber officinale TaxID=94328 RepID=A0A8J5L8Z4_ZINOF|nr:hypothetical protein ZIOFF_037022 [Zingiber officinale]
MRVAQDDTDNFSIIGEAIYFSPNDTTIEDGGYFAIYINEAIYGDRFIAQDMTFENMTGPTKWQAVVMWNNVGLSIFYGCKFLWYQDTLYAHSNIQFYYNREVHDTVNFTISNVATMFQNYHIYARLPL